MHHQPSALDRQLEAGAILSRRCVLPKQKRRGTQPVWIILHILPFAAIAYANPHSFVEWRKFAGEHGDASGQLDLLLFGTAASVVFGPPGSR